MSPLCHSTSLGIEAAIDPLVNFVADPSHSSGRYRVVFVVAAVTGRL